MRSADRYSSFTIEALSTSAQAEKQLARPWYFGATFWALEMLSHVVSLLDWSMNQFPDPIRALNTGCPLWVINCLPGGKALTDSNAKYSSHSHSSISVGSGRPETDR
jgi:hypothetical protein